MLWLVLLVIAVILFYLKYVKPLSYWRDRGVLNTRPWPLIGSMLPLVLRQKTMLEIINDGYKSFPGLRYNGGFQFMKPHLTVRDIDLIKQITVKDFDFFMDHSAFLRDKENSEDLLTKMLVNLNGQKWRNMRATLSPAFTSSKMKAMFGLISDCAQQFTNYFWEQGPDTIEREMKDVFTRFTNDAIATTAFGVDCDSLAYEQNDFYVMGKDATNIDGIRMLKALAVALFPFLGKYPSFSFFPKAVSIFFRRIVKETVELREEKGIVRPDMIHLLMEARKGKLKHDETDKNITDTGFATVEESKVGKTEKHQKTEISDDDMVAQALIFFFAGFETSSSLMCFMAHELAVNPDIQEKLQREIDETLDKCNGKITYEALLGMKYMDMIISETLRMWPPGPQLDRICVKNYVIEPKRPGEKAVEIEKGVVIGIPIYGIHHDPQYFPNPKKFDPERFNDENKSSILPNTYLPFGIGPRNCIGSRFALLENKILFFHLLSKFSLEVVEKTTVPLVLSRKDVRLAPDGGFWLGLKRRSIA